MADTLEHGITSPQPNPQPRRFTSFVLAELKDTAFIRCGTIPWHEFVEDRRSEFFRATIVDAQKQAVVLHANEVRRKQLW